jgi:hypothetical protein
MSVTLRDSGDELDLLSGASEDEGGIIGEMMPAGEHSRAAEDSESSMYLRYYYQTDKAELFCQSPNGQSAIHLRWNRN